MPIRTVRLGSSDVVVARRMFALMAEVFENAGDDLSDAYVRGVLSRPEFWAIAAFADDELVGGVTAHTLAMTRSETAEVFVFDIAVRADHQRRGIGRQLISGLRAEAAGLGIHDLFVAADNEDAHALDFYRALGGDAAPVTIFTYGRPSG